VAVRLAAGPYLWKVCHIVGSAVTNAGVFPGAVQAEPLPSCLARGFGKPAKLPVAIVVTYSQLPVTETSPFTIPTTPIHSLDILSNTPPGGLLRKVPKLRNVKAMWSFEWAITVDSPADQYVTSYSPDFPRSARAPVAKASMTVTLAIDRPVKFIIAYLLLSRLLVHRVRHDCAQNICRSY